MAQLNESVIIIKVSKLVKDDDSIIQIIDEDTITNLKAVLEELVNDPKALIEIVNAGGSAGF